MKRWYKLLFWWYYSRVPEHFHQWRFRKSVKLLIQNYTHDKILIKNAEDNFEGALRELDKVRAELASLKMQQIADGGLIKDMNRIFGTDFKTPDQN